MRKDIYNILTTIVYVKLNFFAIKRRLFDTRFVNQSEAKFLNPIKSRCVSRERTFEISDLSGSLRSRRGRSIFIRRGDARDREPKYGWRNGERWAQARGFMVLCELVFDRWCFKAYKSAAAVGQLRFIVDFKRKCLLYAFHTNTSLVYPKVERRSSISWFRLESLPEISRTQRAFLPSVTSVHVQYDGCDNSLHESTRVRLKLQLWHLSCAATISWRVKTLLNLDVFLCYWKTFR